MILPSCQCIGRLPPDTKVRIGVVGYVCSVSIRTGLVSGFYASASSLGCSSFLSVRVAIRVSRGDGVSRPFGLINSCGLSSSELWEQPKRCLNHPGFMLLIFHSQPLHKSGLSGPSCCSDFYACMFSTSLLCFIALGGH